MIIILVLIMMSQAILGRIGDPDQTGKGAAWLRLMWLPVDGLIVCAAAYRWRAISRFKPAIWLTFAIAGWALASCLWSLDPETSLRRSIGLISATLLGLYIAERYNAEQFATLVAITAIALAIGSFAVTFASPTFGIQPNSDAWRGLWFEKNAMGGFMAKGVAACLCVAIYQPRNRKAWVLGAMICAALVMLSTSSTAIVALAAVLVCIFALSMARGTMDWAFLGVAVGFVAVCLILLLLIYKPGFAFELLGKDTTFTGRTRVWEATFRQFIRQPIQGFGYGAFWEGDTGPSSIVRADLNWNARNADNGWLDLLVQIGLVGAALTAAAFIANLQRVAADIRKGPETYWFSTSLLVLIITSLTESVLVRSNDAGWVIFVAALAGATRPVTERVRSLVPQRPPPPPPKQDDDLLLRGRDALVALEKIAKDVRGAINDGRLDDARRILDDLKPSWRSFVLLSAMGQGVAVFAHPMIRAAAIVRIIDKIRADLASGAISSGENPRPERVKARKAALNQLSRAIFERALLDSDLSYVANVRAESVGAAWLRLEAVSPNLGRILRRRMNHMQIPSADLSEKAWKTVREVLEQTPVNALLASFGASQSHAASSTSDPDDHSALPTAREKPRLTFVGPNDDAGSSGGSR